MDPGPLSQRVVAQFDGMSAQLQAAARYVLDHPRDVAPLAQLAETAILVQTESPSFFHTMSPAFVVAEILTALVAGRGGTAALDTVRQMERQLIALDVHMKPRVARPVS